jgi:hypothetical protein
MRLFSGSIAPLSLMILVIGCDTVDPGDCYPNTSGGFGGSGTIPIGAGVGAATGDFLSPPPRQPLDDDGAAANPCVVTTKQTPCNQQCAADYEAAAVACGQIADLAQRNMCNLDAYQANKTCKASCQQQINDCKEACKEKCDQAWEKCRADCPHGDKSCLNQCSHVYGQCLKDCDQRCK